MRTSAKWLTAVLVLLLAAGLAACGGDEPGEGGNNGDDDTGVVADAGDVGDDEEDATDMDAGGEDAAEDTSGGGNDAGDAGMDATPDVSDADGTPDVADADEAMDVSPETDTMDAGDMPPVDSGHTGCSYPPRADAGGDAGCPTGPYGPGSIISSLNINDSCCRDFPYEAEPDPNVDNGLADLIGLIEGASGGNVDFNQNINNSIQNGALITLFEYAYWSDPADDPSLLMNIYFGEDADGDPSNNLSGTAEFLVSPESLDANGDPVSTLGQAAVSAGVLNASGQMVVLRIPVDSVSTLEMPLQDVQISADVTQSASLPTLTAGGLVELTSGKLSGYVEQVDIYNELNRIAEDDCGCGPKLYNTDSSGEYVCNSAARSACSGSTPFCQSLDQNCNLVPFAISGAIDLDVDNDDEADSMSLGAEFEAVGASIIGTAQ